VATSAMTSEVGENPQPVHGSMAMHAPAARVATVDLCRCMHEHTLLPLAVAL
jgi:hypothetical protein